MTTIKDGNVKFRLLLIEDNIGDASLIREMLAESRENLFDLMCAGCLNVGLDRLLQGGIDLVLLGLSLSLDMFIKVYNQMPDIPVVVLGRNENKDIAIKLIQAGAQDYLVKEQMDIQLLERAIRYAIERKRAEKSIQASESRFYRLIEEDADGIIIIDMDGIVRFVNTAAQSLFGRKAEEFVGELFGFPVTAGEVTELDIVRGCKNIAVAEMSVVKTKWEGMDVFLASLRDITVRKKMEEELIRAQKFASMEIMVEGFLHDLGNLLMGITGNIFLVKRSYTEPSKNIQLLSKAEERCMRVKELIWQLSACFKVGLPIKKVGSILKLLQDAAKFSIKSCNIEYEFYISDDLWDVEFNEEMMIHAINNLIDNAREAMPKGGGIKFRAENITAKDGLTLPIRDKNKKYVRICVEDRGCGVSKAHLPFLFDPYFSTKGTPDQKGLGLGLPTVYSIIKKHDGYINIESEEGIGTIVYIYLPAF